MSKRHIFAWAWCIGVVLVAPAAADVRTCNGALTTAGLCAASTDSLLYYAIPEAARADFLDAWGERANYQDEVPCAAERMVDDAGIVVQAGPGESTCAAGNVGELVANPQTKARAVDRFIRAELLRAVREYRAERAAAAAREAAAETAGPEIP